MNNLQIFLSLGIIFIVAATPITSDADILEIKLENNLIQAAQAGDINEVSRLVKEGVDLKQSDALAAAVKAGHLDIAKYLVGHGADPDGKRKGSTISAAARSGNAEILSYLLNQGADINAESTTDTTAISTPLLKAVYDGRLEEVGLLIHFGADVNRLSRMGNTALHQAIRFTNGDQTELVRLLLKNGANPDAKDSFGLTARQHAKSLSSNEITALIQQAKPAFITKAPQPQYTYSLDSLSSETVERLLKLQYGSIKEVTASSGIFYYDGMRPASVECKYTKEYRRSTPELRLLVAICGNGPFDEENLDETLSIVSAILNSAGISVADKPEFRDQLIKDYRVSKTIRSLSYLVPLIGHGIEFVPTTIVQDMESHTSLVVQIAVCDEDLYDLRRVHDAGIGLHDYLVSTLE